MAAQFRGSREALSDELRVAMRGVTWHDDPRCPAFDELCLLHIDHWNFNGEVQHGELVVAAEVADEVLGAFGRIFGAGFPIARMTRIDVFGADDTLSMAANNASAFNFRLTQSGKISQHSFGTAIDINPVQNPMIVGENIYPPAGSEYLDRDYVRPGMIVRPGPVTDAFDELGWDWGGDWTRIKDYHHFSKYGD